MQTSKQIDEVLKKALPYMNSVLSDFWMKKGNTPNYVLLSTSDSPFAPILRAVNASSPQNEKIREYESMYFVPCTSLPPLLTQATIDDAKQLVDAGCVAVVVAAKDSVCVAKLENAKQKSMFAAKSLTEAIRSILCKCQTAGEKYDIVMVFHPDISAESIPDPKAELIVIAVKIEDMDMAMIEEVGGKKREEVINYINSVPPTHIPVMKIFSNYILVCSEPRPALASLN